MAWDINEIYESIRFLIRKNQAGSISAKDLFYAWNIEQRVYHSNLLGRFQNQSNGKSGVNTGLIENETILTKLSPFTIKQNITPVGGIAAKPAGFIYQLSLRINDAPVEYFEHDQRAYILDSVIDPPSIPNNKYYYTEYQGNYEFLPNAVTQVTIDYIEEPIDVVWAYTFDIDGRQVYNPLLSIQPQWDGDSIIEITKSALTNLGVSFKDGDFTNFGRIAQNTGN